MSRPVAAAALALLAALALTGCGASDGAPRTGPRPAVTRETVPGAEAYADRAAGPRPRVPGPVRDPAAPAPPAASPDRPPPAAGRLPAAPAPPAAAPAPVAPAAPSPAPPAPSRKPPDLSRTAPPSTTKAAPRRAPEVAVGGGATVRIGDWSAPVRRGGQQEVDACREAVQWAGPDFGAEDGYAMRTIVLVGHDFCGFGQFATLPVGTVVHVDTPRGSWKYRVYAGYLTPGRGTPAAGLYWGDLTLQSCVGPDTGFSYLMRI